MVLILKSILKKKNILVRSEATPHKLGGFTKKKPYPMVVMKLVVKDPSENRNRRQLLPTPDHKKKNKIVRCKRTTEELPHFTQ